MNNDMSRNDPNRLCLAALFFWKSSKFRTNLLRSWLPKDSNRNIDASKNVIPPNKKPLNKNICLVVFFRLKSVFLRIFRLAALKAHHLAYAGACCRFLIGLFMYLFTLISSQCSIYGTFQYFSTQIKFNNFINFS